MKAKSRRRIIAAAFGLGLLITIGVALVVGELTIRVIHLMRDGIPFSETPSGRVGPIVLDPRVGWRATDWYAHDLQETTAKGEAYSVHLSQGRNGFRQYGNTRRQTERLLVIGDSFTQATTASDKKTYHALLKQELGMEVFAYGAGGYGTLQEYMVLDEVIDDIRPTMVLWQFCTNDFVNNDHALEVSSTLNNNGWTRPYWEKGQVELRSPKPSAVQTREWISHHSRFLYFLVSRIDRLRARTERESVEFSIQREGMAHLGFARSVQTTDELMGRVRARVGKVPIHAFSCENEEPYNTAFAAIAQHHDIRYWADVPDAVQEALRAGADVLSSDGHWNEQGHSLIAKRLAMHLQRPSTTVAKE